MNSPFMEDVAGEIASKILEEKKNSGESVNELYRYLLGRGPSAEEQAEALALLGGTEVGGDPARWTTLVQALLGTAEFRYVF